MTSLIIFTISFLQEIIFFIPSSLVQFYSGILAVGDRVVSGQNFFDLFLIMVIPSTLGMLLGSILLFLFLRSFKTFQINDNSKLKKLNKFSAFAMVLIARSLPIFSNTLVTAFVAKMNVNLKTFITASFFGLLIRSFIQGSIGWFGFQIYQNGILNSIIIIAVLINLILFMYLCHIIFKHD